MKDYGSQRSGGKIGGDSARTDDPTGERIKGSQRVGISDGEMQSAAKTMHPDSMGQAKAGGSGKTPKHGRMA